MKGIFLQSTKFWVYLIEIPVIILLSLALRFNGKVDSPLGLIPLIVFCILLMAFIFVYFFRGIYLSYEEIRMMGLFSSKDRALIAKDKELVISVRTKGRVRLELFGTNEEPTLEWLKDESVNGSINLFRETAVGGVGTVRKILKFFEIPSEDFEALLGEGEAKFDYELIEVCASTPDEERQIRIKFKETV